MSDSTFKILKDVDKRSEGYQDYRKEWDRRGKELDPGVMPVHLDIELSALCDLRCEFCNIWTHEHIRTLGFKDKATYKPGLMDPQLFFRIIDEAAERVSSIKLNYRGEPTLHPQIISLVEEASLMGFTDIMMNTNGCGGARNNPDLFAEIVEVGITSLMFSVDACEEGTYQAQRIGGDWSLLLQSVRSAVKANGEYGDTDCRIRASAVRTKLNRDDIDSGRMKKFWVDEIGVDWLTVSECYYPAGEPHVWAASNWEAMIPDEFQCADPFRRMVITWDGKRTFPCCMGFTAEVDGGDVVERDIVDAWHSPEFNRLRKHHMARTWEKFPMCRSCPLTYRPVDIL